MSETLVPGAALIRRLALLLIAGFFCSMNTGCAVMMAANAPGKKNMGVLTPGVSRSQVVAELGPPVQSRKYGWGAKDVFAFKQGYSTPAKVSRSVVHGAADFMTLGLWEIAGTPLEGSLQGEDVRAEVAYDASDTVQRVEYFSGAHLAHGGMTLAGWMRGGGTRQTAVIGDADFGSEAGYQEIIQTGATSDGTASP